MRIALISSQGLFYYARVCELKLQARNSKVWGAADTAEGHGLATTCYTVSTT